MTFAFHYESSGLVTAAAPVAFDYLDDPWNLARHMESGSAAMAGARMAIETDNMHGKAVGSVIRMRGRMMGIAIELDEAVTQRQRPYLKIWKTIGEPKLLVIGAYRMGLRIRACEAGSLLTVFIDYDLPRNFSGRLLGRVLAPAYARWCCRRMVEDAARAFRDQNNFRRPTAT